MRSYQSLISQPEHAPPEWRVACAHSETTLHQLSPYIGKLKSSIAHAPGHARADQLPTRARELRRWLCILHRALSGLDRYLQRRAYRTTRCAGCRSPWYIPHLGG